MFKVKFFSILCCCFFTDCFCYGPIFEEASGTSNAELQHMSFNVSEVDRNLTGKSKEEHSRVATPSRLINGEQYVLCSPTNGDYFISEYLRNTSAPWMNQPPEQYLSYYLYGNISGMKRMNRMVKLSKYTNKTLWRVHSGPRDGSHTFVLQNVDQFTNVVTFLNYGKFIALPFSNESRFSSHLTLSDSEAVRLEAFCPYDVSMKAGKQPIFTPHNGIYVRVCGAWLQEKWLAIDTKHRVKILDVPNTQWFFAQKVYENPSHHDHRSHISTLLLNKIDFYD